ncbi:MAG: cystathionine beta-synthase [Phycisphaerae bacterium]|nr:cystathionine beta-synthase [Phycisphaerae bacterium]
MGKELDNILQAVGGTPLVRLTKMARGIKSAVYVKPEMLNPGGSVKDRIAIAMIAAAEREGKLRPGGTIVEATAGNTGAGLALVAALKGYRCIFVLPDKMSQEKINLLRAYGAEIVITPTSVPPDSPESYNGTADRLAREIPNSFRPNQFENPNNPRAHYLTTGPEIWEDSGGKVEVFVAGMGTGGTISGTGRFLKEKNPNLIIVGADPQGSILSGDAPQSYQVEGIGEDFIPKTFHRQLVDEMVRVTDEESFLTARRLAREEGILAGGSSGTALTAALQFAQRLEEPKYIAVLLPDTGRNYLNKIYSDQWMMENGFLRENRSTVAHVQDALLTKKAFPPLIYVSPRDNLICAIARMQEYNISQLPVIEANKTVGSINEESVMRLLHDGLNFEEQQIGAVMGKPLPALDSETDISEAFRLLLSGASGIVVVQDGTPRGVITKSDLVSFWTQRKEEPDAV